MEGGEGKAVDPAREGRMVLIHSSSSSSSSDEEEQISLRWVRSITSSSSSSSSSEEGGCCWHSSSSSLSLSLSSSLLTSLRLSNNLLHSEEVGLVLRKEGVFGDMADVDQRACSALRRESLMLKRDDGKGAGASVLWRGRRVSGGHLDAR